MLPRLPSIVVVVFSAADLVHEATRVRVAVLVLVILVAGCWSRPHPSMAGLLPHGAIHLR
jgi:hypothetical protein